MYSRDQYAYLKRLREERLEKAREQDKKAFDAFVKAQYERLFRK